MALCKPYIYLAKFQLSHQQSNNNSNFYMVLGDNMRENKLFRATGPGHSSSSPTFYLNIDCWMRTCSQGQWSGENLMWGHVWHNWDMCWWKESSCCQKKESRDTQAGTCKTGEICIRSVGCISVSFLVVILYCSHERCCHWGTRGEGHVGSLCIISYNCI